MARSTNIVIFLLLLNASAGLLTASGVAADWGIQPDPGGDQQASAVNSEAQGLSPGKGGTETLFGLFITAANTFKGIFGFIFAGPLMLINLGLPSWLVTFVFAPQYVLVAVDLLYLFTGRDVS
jgi:hypothetical protein